MPYIIHRIDRVPDMAPGKDILQDEIKALNDLDAETSQPAETRQDFVNAQTLLEHISRLSPTLYFLGGTREGRLDVLCIATKTGDYEHKVADVVAGALISSSEQ